MQVQVSYEIDAKADGDSGPGDDATRFREESILLGDRTRKDHTKVLRAELVGDLSTFQTPPSLANKVLLLPKYPTEDLAGQPDRTYQLLVEREQVAFEGTECNKVGTSFVAFQSEQANGCNLPRGSCLANQIKDLRERDLERLMSGQVPSFFLHAHGLEMREHVASAVRELAYPIQDVQTTLVRLELSADNLKFARAVAPGSLKKVELVDMGTTNTLMVAAANTDPALTA